MLDRNSTANAGVVPLRHSHFLRPIVFPMAFLRPDTFKDSFFATPLQTRTGLSMHNVVAGKSALHDAALVFFLCLLGTIAQRYKAVLRLLVYVVLPATEDILDIREVFPAVINTFLSSVRKVASPQYTSANEARGAPSASSAM